MEETLNNLTGDRDIYYCTIPVSGYMENKELSLTINESNTYNSFTNKKRKIEWLSGRYVAKKALENFNGEINTEISSKESGQPYFPDYPDVNLSISHSNDYAVAVVAKVKVGVDIELIEKRPDSICNYFYSKKEREQIAKYNGYDRERIITEIWTKKEAISKLTGMGGSLPFNKIETGSDRISLPDFCKSITNIELLTNSIDKYSVTIAIEDNNG